MNKQDLAASIGRHIVDILDDVTTFTAEQITAAVTPHPATGEPTPVLVTADHLERLMTEAGVSTALVPIPVTAALAKRINQLHADALAAEAGPPPGERIDTRRGTVFWPTGDAASTTTLPDAVVTNGGGEPEPARTWPVALACESADACRFDERCPNYRHCRRADAGSRSPDPEPLLLRGAVAQALRVHCAPAAYQDLAAPLTDVLNDLGGQLAERLKPPVTPWADGTNSLTCRPTDGSPAVILHFREPVTAEQAEWVKAVIRPEVASPWAVPDAQ